jgi:hypothetical protein
MPFEVAPAPVPSWEQTGSTQVLAGPKADENTAASASRGLDAAFLRRLNFSLGYVGALALVLVGLATATAGTSALAAFASGYGLAWALLGTMAFLIRRVLKPVRAGDSSRRALWWGLVPLKYLAVSALFAWLLGEAKFPASWIALGFGTAQFLIVAKVAGKLLSGQVKSVRAAYIERG